STGLLQRIGSTMSSWIVPTEVAAAEVKKTKKAEDEWISVKKGPRIQTTKVPPAQYTPDGIYEFVEGSPYHRRVQVALELIVSECFAHRDALNEAFKKMPSGRTFKQVWESSVVWPWGPIEILYHHQISKELAASSDQNITLTQGLLEYFTVEQIADTIMHEL